MPVSSGVRPYDYVGPYPFSGSGVGRIGYSGILFEQAMFVITAEQDIFVPTGTRQFTKYINKDAAVSSGFEPNSTGLNLVRANANFKNYINDMRTRMSGLFSYISTDSPYTSQELLLDFFKRRTGDNPSGSVGNWYHSLPNLAESGRLWDIDLREVQFQPFIRVSKFENSTSSGIIDIPSSPIGPMFCDTAGNLVSVSSRDLGHAAQVDENTLFMYTAAAASRVVVFGDMFEANNTKLYLCWSSGSLRNAATGNCETVAKRIINDEINRGIGFFSLPNSIPETGVFGVQVFNTSPTMSGFYIPVSGLAGFWPRKEEIVTSGYKRATDSGGLIGQVFTSGLHVFDAGLWTHSASGAYLYSPYNGKKLWYRFADMYEWSTSNFGPQDWSDVTSQPALPIAGGNQNLVFFRGITSDIDPDPFIADRRMVFCVYNPSNLNFLNAIEQNYKIISPASPPSVDKFFFIYDHQPPSGVNLSNYYAIAEIAGLSSGPEFYILDSNLDNIAAWDSNTNRAGAPICMINNHLYGYDTAQTSSSGATFRWSHIVFDDPNNSFPPPASSGTTIDNETYVWETRDTVFDNTNGISQVFEPINPNNFSLGGTPYIIDPRGTALDLEDGSVFIRFNAKMKGETLLKTFLGRIKEGTVGGSDVLKIFEFIPLENGMPNWIYGIR